jgi:pyruvate kinase
MSIKTTNTRTKIIATYGPACSTKDSLLDIIKAGVDVMRFNFSHGDHEYHRKGMDLVKQINEENNFNVAILADLQGPKIRVGDVRDNGVDLIDGEIVELTSKECTTTADLIYISYDLLEQDVQVGEVILMDDGKLQLKITENKNGKVKAKVIAGGRLSSKKGVNFPNTKTSVPAMTDKDIADLEFAISQDANWIALSFVRSAEDVISLKKRLPASKPFMKVIAKIEKPEAIDHLDAIIAASDGIMVARGDLGVEVAFERMPLIQKDIVKKCIKAARPVVVATQMMESMISSPTPTRAEITDVANALIDGADAVMLSAETSVGKYPVKVIEVMDKIIRNIEKSNIVYDNDHPADKKSKTYVSDRICYSACRIANDISAKAILGVTVSGYTGFMVSSYRPKSKIYVFTSNKDMLRTLNICWGVKAFYYDRFVDTDETVTDLIDILKDNKLVDTGDFVINCASMPLKEKGRTNMVKVTEVK